MHLLVDPRIGVEENAATSLDGSEIEGCFLVLREPRQLLEHNADLVEGVVSSLRHASLGCLTDCGVELDQPRNSITERGQLAELGRRRFVGVRSNGSMLCLRLARHGERSTAGCSSLAAARHNHDRYHDGRLHNLLRFRPNLPMASLP